MIEGMGVGPAGSLLGAVALALVPMPVLFYYYGKRLREKSKFAPTYVDLFTCGGRHGVLIFVYRFSTANQDSHDSEDAAEDEESGKADAEGVEDPEKTRI
jgi:hypothetical protein